MKAWGRGGSMAGIAIALLALPAAASAYEMPARPPVASFTVKGSHGYKVSVQMAAGSSNLVVSKGRRNGVILNQADYRTTKETDSGEKLEADFGHLGRIAVRFLPSKRIRRVRTPFCEGGPRLAHFGTFEGTIRFNGEGGYTKVDAVRAGGRVTSVPRLKCHFPGNPGKHRHRSGKHRGHSGKQQGPIVIHSRQAPSETASFSPRPASKTNRSAVRSLPLAWRATTE